MKRTVFAAISLLAAVAFLSGCPVEGESGFKSSDQKLMEELRIALKESNIPFRDDEDGFIRYSRKDAAAVDLTQKRLEREINGGVVVKYEDAEATDYLRSVLTSREMKYRVEKRDDGEWTRWYPQNEEQEKEVRMQVVEHVFELKKSKLSTKCKENALHSKVPFDKKSAEAGSRPC